MRRYDQSLGMAVSVKTYGQVGAAALVLISSLLVWIVLKEQSSVYQDDYMQKSACILRFPSGESGSTSARMPNRSAVI
ncbi:hypothetical protein O3V59_04690 [Brevibacillus thermoruber]|uniref:Uncharacterized protein n=1 Tax=Brevibacillus thermoruber TaxID=33942 RepID=A0A9X3TPI8_9BACL|nr:hypothetical protein [Brevibacillus thermoruber]MDA5107648.1 hypothetical protein [Brevibacillus thermoruber]